MRAKRIPLIAVVLAVLAMVAWKVGSRGPAVGVASASPAASAVATSHPMVVLVADMREAGDDCGCGLLIRRVRAAAAKGVKVEEVAPNDSAAAQRYGVKVIPTVVFLDANGKVVARHEGESSGTLSAVSADLAKQEKAPR